MNCTEGKHFIMILLPGRAIFVPQQGDGKFADGPGRLSRKAEEGDKYRW